jgi:hypothetical protein
MKTTALKIQKKLIDNEALTYEEKTFLIGYICFATEFVDYVREERGLPKL